MKTCKKCSKTFPNSLKINDKYHNLQRRKFCLECVPFKTKRVKSYLDKPNAQECICKKCSKSYIYQSNSGVGKIFCKPCRASIQRTKTKLKLVKIKGGACERCGYNTCISALHFHHKNPKEKSFALSYGYNLKQELVLKEIEKCHLLCANCHSELHDGIWNVEELN